MLPCLGVSVVRRLQLGDVKSASERRPPCAIHYGEVSWRQAEAQVLRDDVDSPRGATAPGPLSGAYAPVPEVVSLPWLGKAHEAVRGRADAARLLDGSR